MSFHLKIKTFLFSQKALLYILLIISLFTKAQNISFKKIGLDKGLSELSGLSLEQDKLGRMWIGTRNGLNCWDGVRMKTFFPKRGNVSSLLGYKITDLCATEDFIWARSNEGLSRINMETLSVKRYPIEGVQNICNIQNTILVGTKNGITIYDENEDRFLRYTVIPELNCRVTHIDYDSHNRLWLSADDEFQLIKIENNTIERINLPVNKERFIVNDVLADSSNRVWITTRHQGLIVYHIDTKSFEKINTTSKPFYVESLTVREIIEDKNNRIWVGTFQGLSVFDSKKKTTTLIKASKEEFGLNNNSIYSLYLSNDDNIWIGTYFGGINYGRVLNQTFKHYNKSIKGRKPSFPVIGELIEDKKNNIWIATEGGGLNYYDSEKNTFEYFPVTNDKFGPSQTNIKSLFLNKNNEIMIGTHLGGLNILDINTKVFKHFNTPKHKNHPSFVNNIIEFRNNYLLATEQGVIEFNPLNEEFTSFFKSDLRKEMEINVYSIYIDSKQILWIGTEQNGLYAYDLQNETLKKYTLNEFDLNSIGSNTINQIIEDHHYRLWISTDGGGLCLYNREADNFTTYNEEQNNLSSDFVYGITESRYGGLWVATRRGLSLFDVENQHFSNYTNASGFPLKELNYKALLLTNSGDLFVGGIDGLVSFKEIDLLTAEEDMKILFSNLFVNNKEVRANDNSKILTKDISTTDTFVLRPSHTVFSLSFSSLNYNNNLNNKYQYQLEGFNKDWVNSEFNTSVTYTNLDPGKYTFKVRATDIDYNPLTQEKKIEIIIKPHFLKTWFAYTIYCLFVIGLIMLFNNFFLEKTRALYQLNIERVEKEHIKELNAQKLRFFTNISHEFMTPLTIILSSLEHAFSKYKIPTKLQSPLNLALRNAKRLKNLNSELLEFRKIEHGHLKLRVQKNDIVSYLQNIYEAFEEIARNKGVKYTFIKSIESLSVHYDSKQMDKVFFNLLSNAINHIPEKTGEITIKINNKKDVIEISIIDNGKGIPKEDIERIFNRFYQHDPKFLDSEYHGSGIGLALSQSIVKAHSGEIICESEENQGTIFIVKLLKGIEHISEDQFSDEVQNNEFHIDKELILASEDIIIEDLEEMDINKKGAPVLLIIDDNNEIRHNIKNLFIDKYNIITANNGLEGLETALNLQPDIIISDVLMPKLSGFDMCEKLKRNLNTSHIPIILLTALNSEEDQTSAFKSGADSYCTKPFSSETLKARVESVFQNRAILQKKFSTNPEAKTISITQNIVDQEFLKKANNIIENNLLNSEFNVDLFAAEMHLGRTIFYSKIKTITGQTPNEYIQTIRLKKAADLILNDASKNVTEIAYATGFNSPSYFAITFKNHFGVNPSKYVKRT